ncbi:MAG TPA: glycosyltransferase family 2 protein, partial [Actinomycetota bacterium]|nr:glycosyltransferase family 2 protein [Actinomycetota bacterium]
MSALRFVGGVFAVVLFLMTVRRYARRDVSRLNLIIIGVLSTSIVMLAIDPNLYNPLFSLFKFKEGNNQRLIGVLLLGEIVIVSLLIRNMSYTDAATLSIRHLVEALAVQSFDWDQVERLPSGQRIVVVMPAFNEAENIGAVIHSMPDEIDGYPVVPVVVDDGSEDGTSEVARAAGALVARHPIRRGGGLALRVGYEIGLRLNAVVVVSMDSDGQHVADEMPLLVKPILEDEVDMVNGSRVLGEFERESLVRHLGVHFFSRLVTILTGSRITDVSNGYRATRTDVLRKLNLDQDQFWASELLIEGMRHR